jgi:hypothetical protein
VSRRMDSAGCPTTSGGVYEDWPVSVESGPLLYDVLPRYPARFVLTAMCRFDNQIPPANSPLKADA